MLKPFKRSSLADKIEAKAAEKAEVQSKPKPKIIKKKK